MNEPLLSICIPTYNRAAILQETSRLLIRAIKESGHLSEVEICISDNASTDRTPDVIAALRTSGVNFQSWRAPENRGMLRNIVSAAGLARGQYIALTGDDDPVMSPGGVRALIEGAKSGYEVVIYNSLPVNEGLHSKPERMEIPNGSALNKRLGIFHASFLGNLLVRREAWVRESEERFVQSDYPHLGVVLKILAAPRDSSSTE